MTLEKIHRDDWIIGGVALVLVFDLLVFAWFSLPNTATLTFRGGTIAFGGGSLTATDTPDGWLGVLAVLALLALIAELALERLSPDTQVPRIGDSRTGTRYVLAVVAAACLALKFLLHLGSFSNLGFGFWLGIVLTGLLLRLTFRARHASEMVPARRVASPGQSGTAGPPPA